MNMALGGAAARPSDASPGSLASAAGDKVAITLTDGENTYTKTLDKTATVGDLVNAINASGLASAAVDDAGKLTVTGNSDSLKVGLGGGADADAALTKAKTVDSNTAIGLTAAAYTRLACRATRPRPPAPLWPRNSTTCARRSTRSRRIPATTASTCSAAIPDRGLQREDRLRPVQLAVTAGT